MKAAKFFGAFLVVWITGCAIADYGFHLAADSWRMLWGAVVMLTATFAGLKAIGD